LAEHLGRQAVPEKTGSLARRVNSGAGQGPLDNGADGDGVGEADSGWALTNEYPATGTARSPSLELGSQGLADNRRQGQFGPPPTLAAQGKAASLPIDVV
jgi:hypothetical protein